MTTETGGPAFPHTVEYKGADCGGVVPHGGMTLRDYIAIQAMPSALKILMREFTQEDVDWTWHNETDNDILTSMCYEMADAMLEVRKP